MFTAARIMTALSATGTGVLALTGSRMPFWWGVAVGAITIFCTAIVAGSAPVQDKKEPPT